MCVADEGDTLELISRKHTTSISDLLSLNPHITDPYMEVSGQCIRLPYTPPAPSLPIPVCPAAPPREYLDTWLPAVPLEQMEKNDYDVLIIGTGAGGGAVLWRLCEQWRQNGKRIGVIEAGDFLVPTHLMNLPAMNVERYSQYWHNPKFWKPAAGEYTGEPRIPLGFERLYAVGGQTLFWWACTPRMHPSVLAEWPVSLTEMDKYYNIAEQIMSVTQRFSAQSMMTRISLERLRGNGFPESVEMPQAIELQGSGNGQIHSNAFFSSMAFLAMAFNIRPVELAVKARAVRVLPEKGSIKSVQVTSLDDRKSYELTARTVVLSAGTLETPRILLNSDIKGEAIGHYLTSHSGVPATGIVERSDFPEDMGALTVLVPSTAERPYQVQIYGPGSFYWNKYREMPLRAQWDVLYSGAGEVESRYENYVSLNPRIRDDLGVPEIEVHFSYSERDMEIIRRLSEAIKRISHAIGIPAVAAAGASETCLRYPGSVMHELGTCRIGSHPSTSAADPYGQIHGVSGLYVANNSVLPTSGASNPVLSTVALAIRTADHIIHRRST